MRSMNVKDIDAINQAFHKSRALEPGGKGDPNADLAYYGYVDVTLFDCPPFVMFTNNDSPVVKAIMSGSFEPQSMRLWCHLARKATGILDIGANVGVYSLCAAGLRPDLQVHAFEPNPYAFARLRMHKALNAADNIQEHTVAVGDANGIYPFAWKIKAHGNIASGGRVGETTSPGAERTVVSMATLNGTGFDKVLGSRGLIKIDVEGTEAAAFKGMTEVLALKPDIILETFEPEACVTINAMLQSLGYRAYAILEGERRLVAQDGLKPRSQAGSDFNQFLTTHPLPEFS